MRSQSAEKRTDKVFNRLHKQRWAELTPFDRAQQQRQRGPLLKGGMQTRLRAARAAVFSY